MGKNASRGGTARGAGLLYLVVAAAATWATSAKANTFDVTLSGEFWNTGADNTPASGESLILPDGTLSPFTTATPFTFNAVFDTNSPNLVATKPWPGFVAYQPSSLTLAFGGSTYQVETYNATHSATAGPSGLAVSIFDYTTPFGNPGTTQPPANTPPNPITGTHNHLSIGFIQDPFHDGAGVVGDWLGSTDCSTASCWTSTALVTTTFTGAYGVGFGSGVGNANTPTPLFLGGQTYYLQWGNENVTFGAESDLGSSDPRITDGFGISASLVPEPGSLPLLGVALALFGILWHRPRAHA
jgi:hypothetical protein